MNYFQSFTPVNRKSLTADVDERLCGRCVLDRLFEPMTESRKQECIDEVAQTPLARLALEVQLQRLLRFEGRPCYL